MNKREKGLYALSFLWNGRRHIEYYKDKSRALIRKDNLENYRDKDDPDASPFTDFKLIFLSEDKLPPKYQS